ncbi:MAG TPA: hypothetical protein VHX60_18510 [Acidobacteriaceae bacterium]|jgi:hypothetical protein|nr:hypothetical protein [Acidobacteriaceae bacterium]
MQTPNLPKPWLRCRLGALLLGLIATTPAWAHIGPPYPIMQNRKIGPLNVEVWSNPDVGVGSFFVVIDPPKGGSVPADMKVQVAVQPVTHRLAEKTYDAWRDKLKSRIEFKAIAPFDQEEMWHVRVILTSASVSGETDTDVLVTPTLLGRWNLLLFLLPFAGIGFVWFKAARVRGKRRKKGRRKAAPRPDAVRSPAAADEAIR